MVQNRHQSTYAPFCPDISLHPYIDYSGVVDTAVKAYPGAKDTQEALVFALKHSQMRIDKAIQHYSNEAHRRDETDYAALWELAYMSWMETRI